jgi:transposase
MINPDKRAAVAMLHRQGMKQREISRRLGISRNTTRRIIKQKGESKSRSVRCDKIQLEPSLLRRLHKDCKGQVRCAHEKLTKEHGVQVCYSTLRRAFAELGLQCVRSKLDREADAQNWLTEIIHRPPSLDKIETELGNSDDFPQLLYFAKNGRLSQRNKAMVVLGRKRGYSNRTLAGALKSSKNTTKKYYKTYCTEGLSVLFGPGLHRSEVRVGDAQKTPRILELLHHKPSYFGINRTSWTQKTLIDAYRTQYNEMLSRGVLTRILKKSEYKWKRARRVLTSPDPDYHEKVERLLRILRSLTEDEMFYFLDEWGPVQVKKRGGRAYRRENDVSTIPRRQKSKGTVTLVGALSATTNQMTWLFEPSKDTHSTINLLEILYNQNCEKSKIYISWDTVSWHGSIELLDWLDHFNDTSRNASMGPIIELVPLPTSAQFLNVIEGVFTAMTKAVIHNSDYSSSDKMKCAISRHFRERNAYFRENPRRAGKKIWDLEFFSEHDSFRSGNYGEW